MTAAHRQLPAYTAHATVTRGTFTAEICADGGTPAIAFELLNSLLRQMKLKAPRGKKWEHLAPVVRIGLTDRTDVLEDADAYAEQAAVHREQLATHAHGLTYALCAGTPELFGEPEAPALPPAPTPTPAKPRTRRPTYPTIVLYA